MTVFLVRFSIVVGLILSGQALLAPSHAARTLPLGAIAAAAPVPATGGDGGRATVAHLQKPDGVALDAAGNLYIADLYANVVRRVDHATGIITTIAGVATARNEYGGDDGPARLAYLNGPAGLALDAAGNLYIADYGNSLVRRVDHATDIITTVAGVTDTTETGYSGDGGPATEALLNEPSGLALDAAGNLYIADYLNNVVRRVDHATGIITTVAGRADQDADTGDGGPATAAAVGEPVSVALDAGSNLYIADWGTNVVRRVNHATGIISTVAGTGDAGYSGDGGPATAAQLNVPEDVALDAAGNLYIADVNNNVVRRVNHTTGVITTLAGTGERGFSGDGGPARAARLNGPSGVALDSAGNLYIADEDNGVVRRVDHATGIITTVAGTAPTSGPTATPAPPATPLPTATPVPQVRIVGYTPAGAIVRAHWLPAFHAVHPAVQLSFAPASSTAGTAALLSGAADLALRDGPLAPRMLQALNAACGGRALHVSLALMGTALVYNLPHVRAPLRLSPAVVSDLLLGHIHTWNDPRLAVLNAGVRLPALAVRLYVRSDGSRESAALHAYLAAVAAAWRTGSTAHGAWPAGVHMRGAAAMARAVLGTPGALGYLDLSDARRAPLAVAALMVGPDRYVRPAPDTLSAAAASRATVLLQGRETVLLSGTDAPHAYPLTSALVADLCAPGGTSGRPVGAALALARYLVTAGQSVLPGAGYGALPARVRGAALAALAPSAAAVAASTTALAPTRPTPTP